MVDEAEVSSIFSNVYKNTIESIIDEVCLELIPQHQVVRIDSLELDLGNIKLDKVHVDFPRAIKHAIKEEVYRHIRDGKVQSWIKPSELEQQKEAEDAKILDDDLWKPENQDPNNYLKSREETLLHYLKTGLTPWHYQGGLSKLKEGFSSDLPLARTIFLEHLSNYSEILRATQFFEVEIIEVLLLERYAEKKNNPLNDFGLVKSLLHQFSKLSNKQLSMQAQILEKALAPKKELFLVSMAQLLSGKRPSNFSEVIGAWPQRFQNQIENLFQKEIVLSMVKCTSEEKKQLQRILKETKNRTLDTEKSNTAKAKTAENVTISSPLEQMSVGESLAVNNAGLILVWPYLQAFFTGLNLMQDRAFIDDAMSAKAVHLLHYLVFKSEAGDETMWVLNKLLCGLTESEFIPQYVELSSEEMNECENLLAAVVENWPVLKNTSPDSLRNTFLKRNGLLVRNESGWLLKVERQSFDILIDRLNWTISTVKLPWNNFMIQTEW